jgi:hypothetical protein
MLRRLGRDIPRNRNPDFVEDQSYVSIVNSGRVCGLEVSKIAITFTDLGTYGLECGKNG